MEGAGQYRRKEGTEIYNLQFESCLALAVLRVCLDRAVFLDCLRRAVLGVRVLEGLCSKAVLGGLY